MELNRDFQEFLKSFVQHDVRFLIIGGYAIAAHGHPRYTKDLDVWVWPDPANAGRILAALVEFGFGSLGLEATDFLEPGVIESSTKSTTKIGPSSCFASNIDQTSTDLDNKTPTRKERTAELATLENEHRNYTCRRRFVLGEHGACDLLAIKQFVAFSASCFSNVNGHDVLTQFNLRIGVGNEVVVPVGVGWLTAL